MEIDGQRVYEMGYLLSPLISPEEVESNVERLVLEIIRGGGGEITYESSARLTTLAYPISCTLNHKREVYNEAYFGAVRFRLTPAALPAVITAIKGSPFVLRLLLVGNVPPRPPIVIRPERSAVKSEPLPLREGGSVSQAETKPIIDTAEIDREIDDLLAKV